MPIVNHLIEKLQRHPKRVVFPEGNDPRVLQAARQWVARRMGAPILLGDRAAIKANAARLEIQLQGIRVIDPAKSDEFEAFAAQYAALPSNPGMTLANAREVLRDPSYFASLMLVNAQADALVGGGTRTTGAALRSFFQIIPKLDYADTIASLMVVDFDEKQIGSDGSLFFADCGVIPDPSAEQLADIAVSTARIARHLTNEVPRVAMLSWASKGDSQHPSAVKIRTATSLARAKVAASGEPVHIDGELQVDAALDPVVAATKGISGPVAGHANVLIFPDLAAGSIAFKLIRLLASANTYGQILTGLSRPAAEVSRGASAHEIFGAAAIVGCQAIDGKLLYGTP